MTEKNFDSYGCSLIEHSKITQVNDQQRCQTQISVTIHIVNTNIIELKSSQNGLKDPK